MRILASGALLQVLLLAGAAVGQPTSEQAGAALSAGRLDEASALAESCLPDPACALVRGRALFGLGRLADAAEALRGARTGNLAAHAAKLQGEALVLAGRPADALEPLRAAEQADPDGSAGMRASALLADALLTSGEFAEAAEQARKAAQVSPLSSDVRAGLDLIRAEAFSGRVDAGEKELARALAADGRRTEAGPALAFAWKEGAPRIAAPAGMLLARDRARRGNDAEAVRILDQLARRHPQSGEAEEAAYVAARLQLDQGKEADARRRLARIARRRNGVHASDARWTLAWLSYRRGLPDTAERFAEFTASADSDALRAQGLYWQSRVAATREAGVFLRRVVEIDPLGYYGLLARQHLGQVDREPPPFPPASPPPQGDELPPRLALAADLFRLGLLTEASAEADRFVRQNPAQAVLALPVYERAQRYDRSFALAQSLLGWKAPRPDSDPALLEGAYPAAYAPHVSSSAARAGVDPYLLLAIARRESLFRPDTRSSASAVGLMQLLPATARRAAIVLGRPSPTDADMAEPQTAIDLGAWYLSELLGRFGDPAIAAAAYNAGPRVALPWAVRSAGQPLDQLVEEIPYRETRTYVKVVLGAWSAYRILAGGAAPALTDTIPVPKPGDAF